jgi:hypothetical protein
MMHEDRTWCVSPVESAEELARKLTETVWCCCTGFALGDYLWLNDSFSPDGAQEYAVLQKSDGKLIQIESITFGWCNEPTALRYVKETLAGEDNIFRREVEAVLETPDTHARCRHCA